MILFAEVVLPLPLPGTFTYSIPTLLQDELEVGQRVVVQFGKRKLYTGIVYSIHDHQKPDLETRALLEIVDSAPVVLKTQLDLWEWVSKYYLCSIGEVMRAALPAGLKLSSDSVLVIHPEFDGDVSGLEMLETEIVNQVLDDGKVSLEVLEKKLAKKNLQKAIRELTGRQILAFREEISVRYKPKKEAFISVSEKLDDAAMSQVFDQLERAPKQLETLMAAMHLIRSEGIDGKAIARGKLLKDPNANTSALDTLVKKDILVSEKLTVDRIIGRSSWAEEDVKLTDEQFAVFKGIEQQFEAQRSVLLEGVTSSGKTEIYIKFIEELLTQEKQVLYLLPEIALTAQFINRLQKYFGEQVGIYHSRISGNERVELWNRQLDPKKKMGVVIGARSAVWLPFQKLDLIIVDEEHDTSYKQHDPSPRFNGRDLAQVLATKHEAKVLLGTATPSLESRLNAERGKFGHVRLNTRYGGIQLPKIVLSDLKIERKERKMKGPFTSGLFDLIKLHIDRGEQAIIFQNRRGFSPFIECDNCGWVPHCRNCDISLSYHKATAEIKCHYCGFSEGMPDRCKACNSTYLTTKGIGTEQIENELELMFPEARIGRLDLDTSRSRNSYQQIISDFETGQTDVLVGTQMVTKGLDFDKVGLVAILNADQLMNYPDFRSMERAFQLMVQVSGRAGRRKRQGTVVIQTSRPDHPLIKMVQDSDYESMYQSQLQERQTFQYPPLVRMINMVLRSRDQNLVNVASEWFASELRKIPGPAILGPEFPLVKRIRNRYHKHILVKMPKSGHEQIKGRIQLILDAFRQIKQFGQVSIYADVDP